MARFAEAVEHAGVDIVPRVVIGSRDGHDGTGGPSVAGSAPMGGSVFEALLAILLSERAGVDVSDAVAERSPAAVAVREQLTRRLASSSRSSSSDEAASAPARALIRSASPAPSNRVCSACAVARAVDRGGRTTAYEPAVADPVPISREPRQAVATRPAASM